MQNMPRSCAREQGPSQPISIRKSAYKGLSKTPDDVLNSDGENEVGGRYCEIPCDGRQKQAEALANAHASCQERGGSDQSQSALTINQSERCLQVEANPDGNSAADETRLL